MPLVTATLRFARSSAMSYELPRVSNARLPYFGLLVGGASLADGSSLADGASLSPVSNSYFEPHISSSDTF